MEVSLKAHPTMLYQDRVMVSILVVVEVSLKGYPLSPPSRGGHVSILVVVEVSLKVARAGRTTS